MSQEQQQTNANVPTTQNQNPQVALMQANKKKATDLLNAYKSQIAQALPRFLTPDRMIRVALTAMAKTPKLMECTQTSIISCVLTCAQLGLLPDSIIGEAYLIPFNNRKLSRMDCQLIVGYKGLVTLAMRSGQVSSISARAVYEGDEFEYELGLEEKLKHKPCGETDPLKITHFYAIVRMINGGRVFNVLTRKEVEAVRNDSANYKFANDKASTVWGQYFGDMGCKTVLRRLMKYVPLSPEINRAIGLDEAGEAGIQRPAVDIISDLPDKDQETVYQDLAYEEVVDQQEQANQSKETAKSKADKAQQATLDQMSGK